jgi:hypothetical protein
VVEFARRLTADGRTVSEVNRALAKLGYTPKSDTVRYWVDEDYREEKLRRQRTYRPPGPARRKAWRLRLDRMRELREQVGLSYTSIAALMSHDFEDIELTEHQVRSIFNGTVSTKTVRRLLYPAGGKS